MSPRRRTDAPPVPLSKLLQATPVGRAASSVLISRTLWEEVTGVAFGRRTKPDRLERGTLYVLCASSGWAQELALHAPLIIERLKARGLEVEKIRFRVDEVAAPERAGARSPSKAELARARGVEASKNALAPVARIEAPALRETLAETARAVARRAAEVDAHERAARDRKPRIPGKTSRSR
jgi:hypothetical protein